MIAAGFELIVERPIGATPINDDVARAGVANGSFFNYCADKQAVANAIATEVRLELEGLVGQASAGITDPVERIAGGIRAVADFAVYHPKRTAVLVRSQANSTLRAHPINQGLVSVAAAAQAQAEAAESGVLFWMELCQALMAHLIGRRTAQPAQLRKRWRADRAGYKPY